MDHDERQREFAACVAAWDDAWARGSAALERFGTDRLMMAAGSEQAKGAAAAATTPGWFRAIFFAAGGKRVPATPT